MTVLIDPMEELAGQLRSVEDLLIYCEADDDAGDATLEAGVAASAELAFRVESAAGKAPALLAPGGRCELVPLLVVGGETAGQVAAIGEAIRLLPAAGLPAAAKSGLETLRRAARLAGTPGARILAEVAAPGAERRVLNAAQMRAYVSFARAVVADALELFVAVPPEVARYAADPAPPAPGIGI